MWLDLADLVQLLQGAVVDGAQRVGRAFELAHRGLRLTGRLLLARQFCKRTSKLIVPGLVELVLVREGLGNSLFLVLDRRAQLLHALAELDDGSMLRAYTALHVISRHTQIKVLRAQ